MTENNVNEMNTEEKIVTKLIPQKSRATAGILCFFFGMLGAHQFYAGKASKGIVYLIISIISPLLIFSTIFVAASKSSASVDISGFLPVIGFIAIAIEAIMVIIDFFMILFGSFKDIYGRVI